MVGHLASPCSLARPVGTIPPRKPLGHRGRAAGVRWSGVQVGSRWGSVGCSPASLPHVCLDVAPRLQLEHPPRAIRPGRRAALDKLPLFGLCPSPPSLSVTLWLLSGAATPPLSLGLKE